MTDKNPDLEKLIPVDLLPHSDANSPRPPGHDAILDLLAAEPAVFGAPQSDAGDALNHPADVLTSAQPPAIFGPGNTGIMSPDPTFPGIAPPNVPIVSPFVPPSIPGTDETPAAPLSSLPTLDPALFSTQPFLLPPNETVPPTAAESTAPHPSPPSQSIPNSVRDILPLLPDASPDSTTDEAAPWRQPSCAVADLPHVTAVSGTTGNAKFADVAARRLPEITVNLGEGHRMANRVLAAIGQKLKEAAREQCRNEIHRRFSLFRADMRANFR